MYDRKTEEEYDEALQAVIEANCRQATEHLETADQALRSNDSFCACPRGRGNKNEISYRRA